jgi:alpha-D-xyloside xylohydrolase
MSGFGFWSHDIGGFEGTPDPELFKRWTAFGLLSSHSRLHGSGSYRVPWAFDEEAVEVLRYFTELKMSLMPYLVRAAEQARTEGLPMMRAMVVEFPDDPACTHLERQYMLGDDLLVAPVFDGDGEVAYYVPEGVWTKVLTGEQVVGPRWVRERHSAMSVPLLARPNSVIPFGAVKDRPDYDHADGVTLRAYALEEGRPVITEIPRPDGSVATFTTVRENGVLRTSAEGASGGWQVEEGHAW